MNQILRPPPAGWRLSQMFCSAHTGQDLVIELGFKNTEFFSGKEGGVKQL